MLDTESECVMDRVGMGVEQGQNGQIHSERDEQTEKQCHEDVYGLLEQCTANHDRYSLTTTL